MFDVRIADIDVRLDNRYQDMEERCKDYIVESKSPDLVIGSSPAGRKLWKDYYRETLGIEKQDGEAEMEDMLQHFYSKLYLFDAFWMHACVVELGQEAYAFTAPSGYGKTTHAGLWLKAFGDRARIINGDNPIVRLKQDTFYIYGTPFCGKEGWNVNTKAPLKGICYLKHSNVNRLEKMSPAMGYAQLLRDSKPALQKKNTQKLMQLYERLTETVPFYSLECNMEEEAALIAYEGMRQRGTKEAGRRSS